MDDLNGKTFVVTGATGRQGSAVVRHLRKAGANVRALTRNPNSKKARQIAELGAEIVRGDMTKPETLEGLFEGAAGVYSVQNPSTSSYASEVQQGKNVADAARAANVPHFIQGSAGLGKKTGVPSWDSKLEIESHIKSLGLPLTIFRPMAFMELATDPGFYPMAAVFHTMPNLMGADKDVPWLAIDDLGAIAARAFAEPGKFIGQDIRLASDLQTINELRALYQEVIGKKPPHFPMPQPMFRMFTGDDLILMWKYLRTAQLDFSPEATLAILPTAHTVRTWLATQK